MARSVGALPDVDWTSPERYSSHQPALRWALARRIVGSVVELGMGTSSTPLLAELCTKGKRELWSVEDDSDWFARFESGVGHHVVLDPDMRIPEEAGRPAVVFVDHDSGLKTRAGSVQEARDRGAKIIVVHDSESHIGPDENPVFDGLPRALEGWKYRKDWSERYPFTTALSDTVKL